MISTDKDVRPHDFRRSQVLDRSQLASAEGVLDSFARNASIKLSGVFRQATTLEVGGIDQRPFSEVATDLDADWLLTTYALSPLAGHALVALARREVSGLVDLRLSGDGDVGEREPTELDLELVALIIQEVVDEMARELSRATPVACTFAARHDDLSTLTEFAPGTMCVEVRLALGVAARPATDIRLVLASDSIRTVLEGLARRAVAGGERDRAAAREARRRLREVPLEVVFQFPAFVTTPGELLTLSVGDCLGLGHLKGRPLEVRSEGVLVALAEISGSGVRKAFEVHEEVTRS